MAFHVRSSQTVKLSKRDVKLERARNSIEELILDSNKCRDGQTQWCIVNTLQLQCLRMKMSVSRNFDLFSISIL
jgi:hypothetical protein